MRLRRVLPSPFFISDQFSNRCARFVDFFFFLCRRLLAFPFMHTYDRLCVLHLAFCTRHIAPRRAVPRHDGVWLDVACGRVAWRGLRDDGGGDKQKQHKLNIDRKERKRNSCDDAVLCCKRPTSRPMLVNNNN